MDSLGSSEMYGKDILPVGKRLQTHDVQSWRKPGVISSRATDCFLVLFFSFILEMSVPARCKELAPREPGCYLLSSLLLPGSPVCPTLR